MDNKAIEIVTNYIKEHLDKSDPACDFSVFTVWKCKILQKITDAYRSDEYRKRSSTP